MYRAVMAALVAASVGACSSVNQRVSHTTLGETKALVTTGNLRLVTERRRDGFPPVACTEPSPDYAIAFSHNTTAKAAVKSSLPAGASGEDSVAVEAGRDYDEAVTQGNGRAAAVLALRDGLYAACQSYANGVIGHDAYAMILSQYGHLLVALVGGGKADLVDAAGKPIPGSAAAIDARKTTLSTLIVACVSGNDLTRQVPRDVPTNRLLTPEYCRRVMNGALAQATGVTTTAVVVK